MRGLFDYVPSIPDAASQGQNSDARGSPDFPGEYLTGALQISKAQDLLPRKIVSNR